MYLRNVRIGTHTHTHTHTHIYIYIYIYIRRTCDEASHSVSATTSPLSFLNLPVQLNFTLWYSTISHCARLVTQIILSLSKYEPRIVSTAQSGTKYPYLRPCQIGKRAPFETRSTLLEDLAIHTVPTVGMIYRYFYELHWSLQRELPSLFVVRGHVCALISTSFYSINIQNAFFFCILYHLPLCLLSKRKFKRNFICICNIYLFVYM